VAYNISKMFYVSIKSSFIHMSILYTLVNVKLKTPQNHHIWIFITKQMLAEKRDDFKFAIVNFPYIYVATSHYHLRMAYIYLSTDSIFKYLLCIRSGFELWRTTDRQVDVTEISRVSFDVSISQLLWQLQ
jgi:hypothetical protein